MRPIDAEPLAEGLELHRQATYQKYETERQWAIGYNAGLDRALYSIAHAKTIAPPPNPPLTLEELREMDGEPVWVERIGDESHIYSAWAFVNREHCLCRTADGSPAFFELFGNTWLAYRRRPEEGKTCK